MALPILIQTDSENLYRRLTHLKSSPRTPENHRNGGVLGFFAKKKDLLGRYEKKLEDLEENVRVEQSDISVTKEVHSFCFLSIANDDLILLNMFFHW